MMKTKVFSPYTGDLLAELQNTDTQEVEKIISNAFRLSTNKARDLTPFQRRQILVTAADIMEDKKKELIETAVLEGGKPYVDSRIEVERAINGVRVAAEYISSMAGKQIPMNLTGATKNRLAFSIKEPIGVVFSISAFNHPVNLVVHQTATAIAAGCPVIIKPARKTPLSCRLLVKIYQEAGLPEDWCRMILCDNALTEKIVQDKRISYLSFIGSSKVGWKLRSVLADGTRCALEHGGVAPVIVRKDAYLDNTIPALVKGGFYHAGQVCVSVQRVFVHHEILTEFTEKIVNAAEKLKVGNPMEENTEVGPLIDEKEVDRIESWVKDAREKGGKILLGGKRLKNNCFEPTLILNPSVDAILSKEEVFGPVICIYPYDNVREAYQRANEPDFHFQAAVFTQDIDLAMEAVNELNATAVMINDHTAFRADWMPFGGRDASGLGMGGIPYSIEEMMRDKLLIIKSDKI